MTSTRHSGASALGEGKKQVVMIVGMQVEALDSLQHYFGQVGIQSRCERRVDRVEARHPVVFFSDDFSEQESKALFSRMLSARQSWPLVIITANAPRVSRMLLAYEDTARRWTVLAKPAFGWVIADALRALEPAADRAGESDV